jgi:hypothetical protein
VAHIGGPRGSLVVPTDLEWQWLIGDESALPAIARRLEELGDAVAVTVLVDCATDDALPPLRLGANRTLLRVGRPPAAAMPDWPRRWSRRWSPQCAACRRQPDAAMCSRPPKARPPGRCVKCW